MENYKCELCNYQFNTKYSLERHQTKKKKCNVITEFKCSNCYKCFAQRKNLLHHIEKDVCKSTQIQTQLQTIQPSTAISSPTINNDHKKALNDIIISKISIEKKINMIKLINNTLIDENIIEILNNDLPIDTKIILLNSKINATTINNTTNNNTTNNIQFNNFGNENIDYLSENYLKKLINTVSSANKIGAQSVFLKLSNEIYLNEKHPENQTIKIDNLNNKFCKIKQNNKWITADKNESLQKIFTRACEIVSMCIMENKDMYKEAQLETINGYIEKDFDDEIVIETVKKLALDIYNFYNSSI